MKTLLTGVMRNGRAWTLGAKKKRETNVDKLEKQFKMLEVEDKENPSPGGKGVQFLPGAVRKKKIKYITTKF